MASLLWRVLVLGVLVLSASVCEGRHITGRTRHHHGNPDSVWDEMTDLAKQEAAVSTEKKALSVIATSDDIAPIDIIKSVKPVWFVPINSPFYFGGAVQPCQEGYKRDRFGICREVW